METLGLRFRASVNIESQPPASQVKTFSLDQNHSNEMKKKKIKSEEKNI